MNSDHDNKEHTPPPSQGKEDPPSTVQERIPQNPEQRLKMASSFIIRLYQFLQENKPLEQKDLIKLLELDTPNEELRKKLDAIELELEALYEENQVLRETALQIQTEADDQIDAYELENQLLKEKIKKIDKVIKQELEKRAQKYETIIKELKAKLRDALEKNEKITEVNERIEQLQERIVGLFDKNEALEKENVQLKSDLTEAHSELEILREKVQKLEKKNRELQKKTELQQMVIDGLKRKEKKEAL